MKKIKKFVSDHPKEFALFGSGVAIGAAIGLYAVIQTENNMKITNARLFTDTTNDTQFLSVDFGSGKTTNYLWKSDNE